MRKSARRILAGCAGCSVIVALVVVHRTTSCGASTDVGQLISCSQKRDSKRVARCTTSRSVDVQAPVEGRRVLEFGQRTVFGGQSLGLVSQAAGGASLRAPVGGAIIFANAFRSYGDLILVDACNVVAIVAGPLSLDVPVGRSVGKGEALGRVRKPTSGEPVVYFEVRYDGEIVDPAKLMQGQAKE